MATTKTAPQQHSQPSRKGKRAWRKNVDVSEVQSGLEALREEVIKGGVISEKPSDALFTLDTTGDVAIQKAHRNKTYKPLKVNEIIARRSAVPAIDTRKRPSNVTDGILPEKKRKKTDGVSQKEYDRLRERAYGGEMVEKDIINSQSLASYDPWSEVLAPQQQIEQKEAEEKFTFLDKKKPTRAPDTLKQAPISLGVSARAIPAVSKPKGEASYNPLFEDWDNALNEAGAKEVEAEQKRLAVAAEEERKQRLIEKAQNEDDEAHGGWTEDESAWEGFESEMEADAEWLRKKRPERKTPAERNKVRRRKVAEREAKHEERMKIRDKEAKKIKEIAKEVSAKEKARISLEMFAAELGSDADEDVDDRLLRRRKFGKVPVPERPLELVLPDELQDSLRRLKPEGNLLKDRFRNLLVRGKIETRNPIQQPKKPKRTYTEKWTYKDFTISA
ncbi:hypothetical protein MMC25_006252 [Agyrium rufum]|nr:hypothetical protein [Agyrium rufum]